MKKFAVIFILLLLSVSAITGQEENLTKEGTIKVYEIKEITYPDMVKITFNQAIDISMKKVPGKLIDTELEVEEDYLIYEVEIVTPDNQIIEVVVDPGNGDILNIGPEEDDSEERYDKKPVISMKDGNIKLEDFDERKYPDMVKLSFHDALAIASKKVPGKLIGMELEDMNDYLVYEFKIATEDMQIKEVIVDPISGEILMITIEKNEEEEIEDTVTN